MTDTEKSAKINEMIESCCFSWNGHMKEALKNRMNLIVETGTDEESYMFVNESIAIISFMHEARFLSAFTADKLENLCLDLYYE